MEKVKVIKPNKNVENTILDFSATVCVAAGMIILNNIKAGSENIFVSAVSCFVLLLIGFGLILIKYNKS